MTRVYSSIEAVSNISVNNCPSCGNRDFEVNSDLQTRNARGGYDVYSMTWICCKCADDVHTALYLNRHAQFKPLNYYERKYMKTARQAKGMSLKDLAVHINLRVSDLSDFERGLGEQPPEVVEEIERLLQAEIRVRE